MYPSRQQQGTYEVCETIYNEPTALLVTPTTKIPTMRRRSLFVDIWRKIIVVVILFHDAGELWETRHHWECCLVRCLMVRHLGVSSLNLSEHGPWRQYTSTNDDGKMTCQLIMLVGIYLSTCVEQMILSDFKRCHLIIWRTNNTLIDHLIEFSAL